MAEKQVLGRNGDKFEGVTIPYDEVAERIEAMTGEEIDYTEIGNVRKRLGFEKATKRNGMVIEDADLKGKLKRHCDELNLGWEPSEVYGTVEELESFDYTSGYCAECGEDSKLTHRMPPLSGDRICRDCGESLEA